jgi:hypothetical protein
MPEASGDAGGGEPLSAAGSLTSPRGDRLAPGRAGCVQPRWRRCNGNAGPCHDPLGLFDEIVPDLGGQIAADDPVHRTVVIIAHPHADDDVGREADEPGVAIILGRAGLAGSRPIEPRGAPGAAIDDRLQQRHQRGTVPIGPLDDGFRTGVKRRPCKAPAFTRSSSRPFTPTENAPTAPPFDERITLPESRARRPGKPSDIRAPLTTAAGSIPSLRPQGSIRYNGVASRLGTAKVSSRTSLSRILGCCAASSRRSR